MKKKSIAKYLQRRLLIATFVLVSGVIGISCKYLSDTSHRLKTDAMRSDLQNVSEQLSVYVERMLMNLEMVAKDSEVCQKNVEFDDIKDVLDKYVSDYGVNSIGFISSKGYLKSTDGFENDISANAYFSTLMEGKPYISTPMYNTIREKYTIFVGCPIILNGKAIGAVTATYDSDYLSASVNDLNDFEGTEAFVIDAQGTVIAHKDIEKVENYFNVITLSQNDNSLLSTANAFETIIATENGMIKYKDANGDQEILCYDEVKGTNHWKIVSQIKNSVINREVYQMFFILFGILVFGCCYAAIVCYYIGKKIGSRIQVIEDNLRKMAEGDFDLQIEDNYKYNDEVKQANTSLKHTLKSMRFIVGEVKELTGSVEKKGIVLEETATSMRDGAENISSAISEISTGNMEQSEEIASIHVQMEEFKNSMFSMSERMETVNEIVEVTRGSLLDGKENMSQLTEVFKEQIGRFEKNNSVISHMNESITDINTITSSIQQIVEQTNLLALNAAIEAARVGEEGKGFSVVAEEIRNLSEQSGDSLKRINDVVRRVCVEGEQLYQSSKEMNDQLMVQKEIVEHTVNSFNGLTSDIEQMIPIVDEVYQLNHNALAGVNQISQSIESANAISEELAATSEQVAMTGDNFKISSKEVNDISESIL